MKVEASYFKNEEKEISFCKQLSYVVNNFRENNRAKLTANMISKENSLKFHADLYLTFKTKVTPGSATASIIQILNNPSSTVLRR